MLRIYVAAPWINQQDAIEVAHTLRVEGFSVKARWLQEPDSTTQPPTFMQQQNRAIIDIEDVRQADAFLLLNLGMSAGKATEFGIAYALGIPIVVVGPPATLIGPYANLFYFLPGVDVVETVDEAIAVLRNIERG